MCRLGVLPPPKRPWAPHAQGRLSPAACRAWPVGWCCEHSWGDSDKWLLTLDRVSMTDHSMSPSWSSWWINEFIGLLGKNGWGAGYRSMVPSWQPHHQAFLPQHGCKDGGLLSVKLLLYALAPPKATGYCYYRRITYRWDARGHRLVLRWEFNGLSLALLLWGDVNRLSPRVIPG